MATSPATPRVHVLVVCDDIDPVDENVFHLTGVRTHIRPDAFPYTHPSLCVYLQVAGHEGEASCHVELVPAGEGPPLLITPQQDVPLYGPLELVSVWWRIRNCTFLRPGLYYVQVYFGSKLASERLLVISESGGSADGRQAR
jgi:hypothetical protein